MDTMIRMSRLQDISSEMMSILEREGSKGNSTIFRPKIKEKSPFLTFWSEKKIDGMDKMIRMSRLQVISSEIMSILWFDGKNQALEV